MTGGESAEVTGEARGGEGRRYRRGETRHYRRGRPEEASARVTGRESVRDNGRGREQAQPEEERAGVMRGELRERGSRWSRGNWRRQTPPPPSNRTNMKHISTCLTSVRLEDRTINAVKYFSWGKVVMNGLESQNGNRKRITEYHSPFDLAFIFWAWNAF